ncbi:MAG: M48 family metalloprotease, partial [Salinisphaera sp.]|nr:M48 family metalloprotease [Salinisphaera sp.]
MASAITWLVGCWLALGLVLQAWLVWRQSRFLARNRSEVPESFRGSVTSDEHARAADYGRARLWGSLFDESWSLVLVFVWTLGGGLAILTGWLPTGLPGAIALLAVFSALQEFLRLPARLLQVAAVEARFGFNRAGPVLLLRDAVVRTAVAAVLGLMAGALLLPPVLILGPVGWLLAGLTAVAAAGLLLWAQPRVIAPLFNRFRPLEQGALRTRLETMIARCGARAESMFVMDGSRRSGQANAYFSGFGRAKRVVLFDTLIEDLDDNEIEAVLAQELGHDCEGHFRRHYALLG